MFHHRVNEEPGAQAFAKWYLLSFLSGSVNAGAFLAAGSFVTHVTGFATLFGVNAANLRWEAAVGILFVPAFFLLGTMISAYMVDRRFQRGRPPHYDWVMLLVATCLIAVAIGGHYDMFGKFGEALRLKHDFMLLALLCLASGLQNAAVTSASGYRVRTTHLTGITTDLGIGLVRIWTAWSNPEARRAEARANGLRVGTILSFLVGSATGAALFIEVEYLGFLLPAGIAVYALYEGRLEFIRMNAEKELIASRL